MAGEQLSIKIKVDAQTNELSNLQEEFNSLNSKLTTIKDSLTNATKC
jgi:hypothetical protein